MANYFVIVAALFLLNSPRALGSYELVNQFCSRKTGADRYFCIKTLESDPRSATAKDNGTLLVISVDLASEKLNKTRDYLVTMGPKVKECAEAYSEAINDLESIPLDLKEDPTFVSYNAHGAIDNMNVCEETLKLNKVSDPDVWGRHNSDMPYVELCFELSLTIPGNG